MIKNIIYYISIISILLITFLTEEMLGFIFQTGVYGIIYIISLFLLLVVELFFLISEKKYIKKSYIYNCLIIFIATYVSIIYYNIYAYNLENYNINTKYLDFNYLITAIVLILIIINLVYNKYKKIK